MSPQSPVYPSPASGDDAEASGRHRRPESLADVVGSRPERSNAPAFTLGTFEESFIERGFDDHGNDPGPAEALPTGEGKGRWRLLGRRRRTNDAEPPITGRPPITGSHRAPGTLPLETLLRIGRGRQQAMLASLIIVGLTLIAVPDQQRRAGVHAMDVAAERVIGVKPAHSRPNHNEAAKPSGSQIKAASGHTTEATPTVSRTPTPASTTPPAAKPSAPVAHVPGEGPAHSLRITGSPAVALSFDDGPDPVETPKILALLDKYQVKATFCLVGVQVVKHPEIVRQIVAAGHTLCDHTWSHSLTIGQETPAKIQEDLLRTNAAIRAAVPNAKIPFFRAPGGNFTDPLVSVAASDGMASLYWDVDPRDWDHPAGEDDTKHIAKVIAAVHAHVRPGSIVLSHDLGQPDTIAAYEKLLPWLTQNFRVGLLPEPTAIPTPAPTVTTGPTATPTPTPTPTETARPTVDPTATPTQTPAP